MDSSDPGHVSQNNTPGYSFAENLTEDGTGGSNDCNEDKYKNNNDTDETELYSEDEESYADKQNDKDHAYDEFCEEMDALSNKCIHIGEDPGLPCRMKEISCHASVREDVHGAAKEVLAIVKKHHLIFCPTGEFLNDFQFSVGYTKHMVYAKFIRDKESSERVLQKIGCTRNILVRYSDQVRHSDTSLCIELLRLDEITDIVDKECGTVWDNLLEKIRSNGAAPQAIRCLVDIIAKRGGNALGFKHNGILQLIEIGAQLEWGVDVVGELFACDEKVIAERMEHTKDAIQRVLPLLHNYRNKPVDAMNSWPTGARDTNISSKIASLEHIVGGGNWRDAFAVPVFENAVTTQQIFCNEYSPTQCQEAALAVEMYIGGAKTESRVRLLDTNKDPLYPNGGLFKKLMADEDFMAVATIHGGEIVIFQSRNQASIIMLHRPLGLAADSRKIIRLEKSIQRFMTIFILENLVRYIQGDDPMASFREWNNAIMAASIFEMTTRSFHLSKYIATAAARDCLTPDNIYACIQNQLSKTAGEHVPTSRLARRAYKVDVMTMMTMTTMTVPNNDMEQEHCETVTAHKFDFKDKFARRPVASFIIRQAQRILNFSNTESIGRHVKAVQDLFLGGNVNPVTVNKRWEYLLRNKLVPHSTLHRLVTTERNKFIKVNGGNTNPYVDFDLSATDKDFLGMLQEDGKPFWARLDGSISKTSRPQNPQPYSVYTELVFKSIKERTKASNASKNKENKTQAKKSIKDPTKIAQRYRPLKRDNGYAMIVLNERS